MPLVAPIPAFEESEAIWSNRVLAWLVDDGNVFRIKRLVVAESKSWTGTTTLFPPTLKREAAADNIVVDCGSIADILLDVSLVIVVVVGAAEGQIVSRS